MRIYNTALGKFLSVDPISKEFVWNSPYAFAENDVERCVDLDGKEKFFATSFYNANGELYKTTITIVGRSTIFADNYDVQDIHVYRSSVRYDGEGNATITYDGHSVATAKQFASPSASTSTFTSGTKQQVDPLVVFSPLEKQAAMPTPITAAAGAPIGDWTDITTGPSQTGEYFQTTLNNSITNKQKIVPNGPTVTVNAPSGVNAPDPSTSVFVPNNANAVPAEALGGVINATKDGTSKTITNQPTMDEHNNNIEKGTKTITIAP